MLIYVQVGTESTYVCFDRNTNDVHVHVGGPPPDGATERPCKPSWTKKRSDMPLEEYFIDTPVTRRALSKLTTPVRTTTANFLRELDCRLGSLTLTVAAHTSFAFADTRTRQWLGINKVFDSIKPASRIGKREWVRQTVSVSLEPTVINTRASLVAVSYTPLTLPTIYSVYISVVAVSLKKKKYKDMVVSISLIQTYLEQIMLCTRYLDSDSSIRYDSDYPYVTDSA